MPLVTLEPKVYDLAIELLDSYVQAGRQDVIERRKLRKLKQDSNEKFSHYIIRLRQQIMNCGFEKYSSEVCEILKEIYLIDVVVENCRSDELRKSILKRDRTLKEIEEIAATIEDTDHQMKELKESNAVSRESSVYEIERGRGVISTTKKFGERVGNLSAVHNRRLNQQSSSMSSKSSCYACGQMGHISNSPECPARGRTCRRCQKLGHFEIVCKKRKPVNQFGVSKKVSKKVYTVDNQPDNITEVEEVDDFKPDEKIYYAFYGGNESNMLEATIGGVQIKVLIDSGADANLIKLETWEMLKTKAVRVVKSIKGSARILRGYGSERPLDVVGTFEAEVNIGRRSAFAEFFVVRGGQKDILGDSTAKSLGVLKVGVEVNNVDVKAKPFAKIKGVKASIEMDPEVKLVYALF
nr:uncharacterized protein LOC115268712 [Aedes albopictus]